MVSQQVTDPSGGRAGPRSPLEMGIGQAGPIPLGLKLLMLDQLSECGCLVLQSLPPRTSEVGVSGGGKAAADSRSCPQSPPGPGRGARLPGTGISGLGKIFQETPRVLCWMWQLLPSSGRKSLFGSIMLILRNVQTCQVQIFPVAVGDIGSVGPPQPGEGAAAISEMDHPNAQHRLLPQLFTRNATWCNGTQFITPF